MEDLGSKRLFMQCHSHAVVNKKLVMIKVSNVNQFKKNNTKTHALFLKVIHVICNVTF